MTEGIKTRRLSKVAKEFNIGLATIVEYLNKKGVSVENNPNAKISEEAYGLLLQEFQSEKNLKEATRKAGLNILKRESISMEKEPKPSREEKETEGKEEELLIKDIKGPAKEIEVPGQDKPAEDPSAGKDKEDSAKAGLKIVGKIDLEDQKKKPEPVEKPEKEKEEPSKAEEPVEKKEEDIGKDKTESKLKVLGKIDLEEKKPKKKKARAKKEAEAEPQEKREEKVAEKAAKEEEPAIAEAKKKEEPAKPEAEPVEKPPIEDAKATSEQKEKTEAPATEHYQTQFKKLDGPVILGKMDLPDPKETTKKPVASSSDPGKAKKRKRKRIRKDKAAEQPAPQQDKKTVKQEGKPKKSGKKEQVRPEVSEEEISRQIKETLANLSGAGKSKAAKHRRMKRDIMQQQKEREKEQAASDQKTLQVTEFISAAELASLMDVSVNEIISTCLSMGLFVSINQRLDAETITIVADEFGFEVNFVSADSQEVLQEEDDDPADLSERAPIVTVMGHVDHGKTSLLDQIRHSNIIAGEAGGITQHIGAYSVELDNGKFITFLDTPGHEAFTAMRARGAKVTDVAIIVVAADDSVMPQTVEAINHAQAAGVPIVIAINKVDKENANPEKVKEELANINILVEDWGGKYQSQEISAKKGENIDNLLEKVLLESEMLELTSNPKKGANGTVIESSLDKGRGYVSTILVQNGTLRVGDIVVAGITHGKVKAMFNERGHRITEAGPSTPVLILGLDGAPQAGDTFSVMKSESEAKNITTKRQQLFREQGLRTQKHITLDEIGRRIAIGDFKELNVIVKGDVDGSIEALSDSLLKLSTDEIQVNIIHKAVGQITEGDVLLASASNAIIIGFQVRPSVAARKLAEQEQIDIRLYSVIYNAINELKSAIEGMLSPEIEEKITANLEIREVFKISKVGTIAGCMVLDGKITRNARVRLIRDGIVVYTGSLGSLKRFKDDVKEVATGYECGLNIEGFNDIKVGDIIEAFQTVEIARKLG
ncbi:MAG: translation initiation factor IF-2 [Bacteroidia bacterium]|nr:MAG: translation initiation factor IF-2 [Bacteroidia bacterium]